ncbi:replicative DNA helicase [Candidatus Aerophobetes bacterium]|uniref:Replicative DNA helicase n=1 Tax=Aerophobetes bacterium TaxID=2030807 RepID=A0A2A4X278_UNCAE|nr:MAG: replicative DNA helicase [Candidatus Aerophobetes bacterium]
MENKPKIKEVRVAPHSKESEMMVIGCMLTNINSLNTASDMLDDSDFYFSEHKAIFATLKSLYKKDKPADIHITAEELKREEKLEEIGGVSYLTELAQYAGTSAYIEEYCEIIKNKSILRAMIQTAQEIEKSALSEPSNVLTSLDEAQALFFNIARQGNNTAGMEIKDVISGLKSESSAPYIKELERRQELFLEKGEEAFASIGIPSGFKDLDKLLNGLAPSNLIICAGRPAMGKTAFVLNIAEHVCFNSGMNVGFFSLEMSADQLLHRMVCSQSGVESEKIQKGTLNGQEYQRVASTLNKMSEHTMIIDDQPGLSISDLRARARRMKEAHNIDLLIIDYLQLLTGTAKYGHAENRQQEISEISRMLKNLARELNIPILTPCQLSRKVEERTGHRPMMSDLRESGAIEQDADIVLFLLRREYYDPYDKPGMAEIIIGKNRHGAVGSVEMVYKKELAKFANFSHDDLDEEEEAENNTAFDAFTP